MPADVTLAGPFDEDLLSKPPMPDAMPDTILVRLEFLAGEASLSRLFLSSLVFEPKLLL